jgi:hypothetical protein
MTGKEKLIFTEDAIYIEPTMKKGEAVMHLGEKELMIKLANLVTEKGGDILELGFGLHLSADAIQANPNVTSHTIIEIHPEIYKKALDWAKNKPNTKIIFGNWLDVVPSLDQKFDGVLHDTHRDGNISLFLDTIGYKCKIGCILGFFQYDKSDERFQSIKFPLKEEDLNSLPYSNSHGFKKNEFELKITKYYGGGFHYMGKIKKTLL